MSSNDLTNFQISCTCGAKTDFTAQITEAYIRIFCASCDREFCLLDGDALYIRFRPDELGIQQ